MEQVDVVEEDAVAFLRGRVPQPARSKHDEQRHVTVLLGLCDHIRLSLHRRRLGRALGLIGALCIDLQAPVGLGAVASDAEEVRAHSRHRMPAPRQGRHTVKHGALPSAACLPEAHRRLQPLRARRHVTL